MATNTVEVGHALISHTGEVVRADAGFCAIMRTDAAALVGRGLLELTAPEDRAVCRDCMTTLRESRRPFRVAKRMLRGDGTVVWVDKTVALADFGDDTDADTPPLIMATMVPIADPSHLDDPARLLGMALFMRDSARARALQFSLDLAGDAAWSILLAAYIAEAEGRVLTAPEIATDLRLPLAVVRRWLRALVNDGQVEPEGEGHHHRLTAASHARFESYLANRILTTPASGASR